MDLHTPPPSYEAAVGVPSSQEPINPYFRNLPPSAPSHSDEIMPAPITMPIIPQTRRPTPNIRPYNPTSSYPTTRSTPQTNNILRREQSQNDSKTCVCFFITLSVLVVMVLIMVLVAKTGSTKSKFDTNRFSIPDASPNRDWEEKWWKDNKEFLDNLQNRRDNGQWDFKTNHNID